MLPSLLCSTITLLFATTTIPTCSSFTPAITTRHHQTTTTTTTTTQINAFNNDELNNNPNIHWLGIQDNVKGAIAATVLAGSLWASPSALVSTMRSSDGPIWWDSIAPTVVADAKEMASGSGSRVNKDAESLLRYGLPIPKDKEIRKFQVTIEEIRQDITSKRKAAAIDGIGKAEKTLASKSSATFKSMCRDQSKCTTLLNEITTTLPILEVSVKEAQNVMNGSDQERNLLDASYVKIDQIAKTLTSLEEQMVPAGYSTPVPDTYSDLPQLKGRATVEFIVKKPEKEPFTIEGKNYEQAKMTMVIDGYTAPITGGNFVELVSKGFYTDMKIQRADGFVVQTGDPDGEAEGYVAPPSRSVGKGRHGERLIPSEIFVKGDKGPFYETTIEDEGRGGQATILPFSSYGAMGWAREEYNANSGSSQFFWLLFDSDLTPAGKNVLDGSYPCFGYVVEGAEFLRDAKEGDTIVSAKVTDGMDRLFLPPVLPN